MKSHIVALHACHDEVKQLDDVEGFGTIQNIFFQHTHCCFTEVVCVISLLLLYFVTAASKSLNMVSPVRLP